MGNRAVIVSKDTTVDNMANKVGIYLHWCGSEESIKEFLKLAKEKGIRDVESDVSYFWARFCQVICDEFSKEGEDECSVGMEIVAHLDTHNYDNGVYYIDENFKIVKHTDGSELEYDYEHAKNEVNFYYHGDSGSFMTNLIEAWCAADSRNRTRLAGAFPEIALALKEHNAKYNKGE